VDQIDQSHPARRRRLRLVERVDPDAPREPPEWVTAPGRPWVLIGGTVVATAIVAVALRVTAGPASAAFAVVLGVVNGIVSMRSYRRGLGNGP
jgi:hypothetical protein